MPEEALNTAYYEGVVAAHLNGEHACAPATSPAMRALERVIAGIAPTDIPVLLVGESGTGKQVLATEIHRLSQQNRKSFIHISCAAVGVTALHDWLHDAAEGNGSGTN
jgi:two-component system response regulator AtoC